MVGMLELGVLERLSGCLDEYGCKMFDFICWT